MSEEKRPNEEPLAAVTDGAGGQTITRFAGAKSMKVLTQGPVRNYNQIRREKPLTEKGALPWSN